MNKENCKICNKRTEYMYGMNDGIYCDNHKEVGLAQQKITMGIEMLKERNRLLFGETYVYPPNKSTGI